MNQINKQTEVRGEVAAGAEEETRPLASPSRRRLIRLGASAVPVLATLTSPSALAAGVCRSTSAWGSALINPGTSQAAHTFPVADSWKISAWNDTAHGNGTPWKLFGTTFSASPNPITSLTFAQLSAILANVYTSYYWTPSVLGFNPSELVMGHLTSDDRGYFLVAQLNYAVGVKPPAECVSDANWLAIVAGTYPTGNPWTVSQIRTYLQNNFIVQA